MWLRLDSLPVSKHGLVKVNIIVPFVQILDIAVKIHRVLFFLKCSLPLSLTSRSFGRCSCPICFCFCIPRSSLCLCYLPLVELCLCMPRMPTYEWPCSTFSITQHRTILCRQYSSFRTYRKTCIGRRHSCSSPIILFVRQFFFAHRPPSPNLHNISLAKAHHLISANFDRFF